MLEMYKKSQSLFLVSTVSPFAKNLCVNYENDENIKLWTSHRYRINSIGINSYFEVISEPNEISIETDKEVIVDKDCIIQIKYLLLNKTSFLVVLLHNGLKVYDSEATELVFNYDFGFNTSECPVNYSSGIASLVSSVICIGTNSGTILMFVIDSENKISIDDISNQTKHKRPICDLASDGDRQLFSCDDSGKISVWDYEPNSRQLDQNVVFEGYNGFSCNCLAVYQNYLCAGYGSGHLRVFDILKKHLICEISAHAKWITAIDITRTGFILSTSEDSFVRIWQIVDENDSIKVNHKFSQNIANHMLFGGVFLNSVGNMFCVSGYDSTELHCFNRDSCETNTTF